MSISEEVRECQLCPLSSKLDFGFKPQPGIGKKTAQILVIYDLLSRSDYLTQNYLTGGEGLLFNQMLSKAGLTRDMLYITPALKCYSEDKRVTPCVTKCGFWLRKQIDGLKPKVIVTMGNFSSAFFYPRKSLKELFGQELIRDNMKIVVLPSLFSLMNLGQHTLDYHIQRLRKVNEWVSYQAVSTD